MKLLAGNPHSPYMISHPFAALGDSIDYYWQSHHDKSNRITRIFTKPVPDGTIDLEQEQKRIYELDKGEVFPLGGGEILVIDANNIKLYDKSLSKKSDFSFDKNSHGEVIQVFKSQDRNYLLMHRSGAFKTCKASTDLVCDPFLTADFKSRPVVTELSGQTKLIGISEDGLGNFQFLSLGVQQ